MGNMGYCRFHNTVADVQDCIAHMDDKDLSDSEKAKRKQFIELCEDVANDYGEEF